MRIKQNRTILESDNPFVIEQWKKAGYTEVGGGNELPKDGELQDNQPLSNGGSQNDDDAPKDGEPLTNEESQDEEPKKGRKKAQE